VAQVLRPVRQFRLVDDCRRDPVVTLLLLIATGGRDPSGGADRAVVAIIIAIFLFTMPAGLAIRATVLDAVIGFSRSAGSCSTSSSCTG
jgi:lactate permease